ncbi:MAG TPA: nucleotide exchange factor GrpE [Caulobacteraceae bacterium]|jgi:molecular chaperone GrpE|nr:nucleotide exchange factor GrpE [Caulobacteraceae bacterium]
MIDDETPGEGEPLETDAAAEFLAAADDSEALRAEIAALKDQMLRVAADAENAKRRAEKEANDSRAYAIQKFARDLLGVADNLQRAMQHAPKDAADPLVKNLAIGLEMTEKELMGAFERNGLKKLDPPRGAKFDPHQHQAMQEQPAADVAPGGVLQVIQPGYELFGRLVRPAMVIVAARGSTGPETADPLAQNPYAGANGAGSGASVDTKA